MKRLAIVTNNVECERHIQYYSNLEKYFIVNGWEIREDFMVDLVLFCGCGFHDSMLGRFMTTLDHLKKINFKEENIILMGCLPKTHENDLIKQFKGKRININEESDLNDIIKAQVCYKDSVSNNQNKYIPYSQIQPNNVIRPHKICHDEISNDDTFYIKIAQGCLRQCTFCVINKAKGYIKSIPMEEIQRQYKMAIDKGYRKIFLMGEDTFAYGKDIDSSIVDLINSLLKISSDIELDFGSLHIRWLVEFQDDLIGLCKEGLVKKFNIGLQHVNNELLASMGRPMDFKEVYKVIKRLKKECPDVYLGVDIIVGFPGETEEKFQELVEFFRNDKCINNVRHNGYSDVKGTISQTYDNKVPSLDIASRWMYLKDEVLGDRYALNRSGKDRAEDTLMKITYDKDYNFCKGTFVDFTKSDNANRKVILDYSEMNELDNFKFKE